MACQRESNHPVGNAMSGVSDDENSDMDERSELIPIKLKGPHDDTLRRIGCHCPNRRRRRILLVCTIDYYPKLERYMTTTRGHIFVYIGRMKRTNLLSLDPTNPRSTTDLAAAA